VDFSGRFSETLWIPWPVRNLFSIAPTQVMWEFFQLLQCVEKLSPRRVLEIGTADGGTLFLLARASAQDAELISLDLPAGSPDGGYPPSRQPLYKAFASPGQRIHLVRKDSHSREALEAVQMCLHGEPLDFLFIDGDHSYEGVRQDFEMYAPLVRRCGLIAFHDIVPDHGTRYGIATKAYTGGVYRLWAEVKDRFESWEFVEDPDQDGYGIGVLVWRPEELPRRGARIG
jgi:predicted O-methyltransferase YrrM